MLMNIVRGVLGQIILTADKIFSPKGRSRTAEQQARVDQETSLLAVYEFEACPFCVRVRREMRRLGLNIERRDIRKDKRFEKELLENGGTYQVPCLRIQESDGSTRWMYESADIIRYLRKRFEHV